MALADRSRDWGERYAPSLREMESLSIEAFSRLPGKLRRLCQDLVIDIVDFSENQIVLEEQFDMSELLHRKREGHFNESYPMIVNQNLEINRITLYRRAILDCWFENEETLGDIILHVLIHEISRYFHLTDKDMENLGKAVF
ncbi:MAG: putative Zn-dependent protease [Candidatus Tokpelaia sp. JSC161]|jgi:predicted Zn-dependent protease with MMP-like domain|nr:MAG: putative Zn-dependent protease [Candidatus Tokpelaia sp. JSC161]